MATDPNRGPWQGVDSFHFSPFRLPAHRSPLTAHQRSPGKCLHRGVLLSALDRHPGKGLAGVRVGQKDKVYDSLIACHQTQTEIFFIQ